MGYVGWGSVVDQANTETGGAEFSVADVTQAIDTGFGVGGSGVINTYSAAPPFPPLVKGFILLESGIQQYILQESGAPPIRIQLE